MKTTLSLLVLTGLAGLVLAAASDFGAKESFYEVVIQEWEAWKLIHRKSNSVHNPSSQILMHFTLFSEKNYTDPTMEKMRLKIFMENMKRISKHNILYHQGRRGYKLKMNHYGDLLPHEFSGNIH